MSLEANKIAGAVLGTLVFVMGTGFVSDLLFHREAPEEAPFEIAVAEPTADAPAEEAAPAVEPIAVRLASADAAKGEAVAKACAGCHTFDSGGGNKAGPHLWGVVNRQAGSVADYDYSPAMREFGASNSWDYDHLDHFLTAPKALVDGTKMGYAGLKKPEDRANLIAYLRTLSDSPAPLPTPEAAAPAAEEAPAADAPAAEEAPAAETPAEPAPQQ